MAIIFKQMRFLTSKTAIKSLNKLEDYRKDLILKIEKDDLMLFKRSPLWHYSAQLFFKNFSNLSQTNTNTLAHIFCTANESGT